MSSDEGNYFMIWSVVKIHWRLCRSSVAAELRKVLPDGATGNTPAHTGCVLMTTQYGYLLPLVTTVIRECLFSVKEYRKSPTEKEPYYQSL